MIKKTKINKSFVIIGITSFCSAIPLSLISGAVIQAWFHDISMNIKTVGDFAQMTLPYSLKLFWAPLLDHYQIPQLGARRGWIIIFSLLITLCFMLVGFDVVNPETTWNQFVITCGLIAFFGASYDIVLDAYKIEVLSIEDRPTGAAIATNAYRIALILTGSFSLIMNDQYGWSWQQLFMFFGSLMLLGTAAGFAITETAEATKENFQLNDYIKPFREFLNKKHVFDIVSFIFLYKLDIIFALALLTTFLLSLGFTKTEIGTVSKFIGVLANLLGSFAAAFFIKRWGLKKCLWIFQILQIFSVGSLALLNFTGPNYYALVVTLTAENFFSGLGNAGYGVFLMSACSGNYKITQFALLTSIMSVTRNFSARPASRIVESLGWKNYFMLAMLCGIPSLIFMRRKSFQAIIDDFSKESHA